MVFNECEKTKMQKSWSEVLIPAGLAMLLWGGWAFFINYSFGVTHAVTAATAQGLGSFLITMTLTAIVMFFYRRIKRQPFKWIVPPIAAMTIVGGSLVAGHMVAHTAALVATALPPLSLGFFYCSYCVFKMYRAERATIKTSHQNAVC